MEEGCDAMMLVAAFDHCDLQLTSVMTDRAVAAGFDGILLRRRRDDLDGRVTAGLLDIQNRLLKDFWLGADFGMEPAEESLTQAVNLELDGILFSHLGLRSSFEPPVATALFERLAERPVDPRLSVLIALRADDDLDLFLPRLWQFGATPVVRADRLARADVHRAEAQERTLVLQAETLDVPDGLAGSVILPIHDGLSAEALTKLTTAWREHRAAVFPEDVAIAPRRASHASR